ncbi:TATA element modulatory factor isoform X2 [Hemiscyllium ocellatum]|uniref:TATA element modulatory factor isoform X2 n=1 Tax=Hemiscyllium ocellatum TaxID=170820 RepID=UPI002965FF5A|nr:TATA element modulatory factor isoform X2 [Hemiscyllium ocellatum]
MSWFNASHLSTFAKQALSQAQKSIDRVLDIQEDEGISWSDSITMGYEEAALPGKNSSFSEGWVSTQWGSSTEDSPKSHSTASPKAITTPVTRTVVDESETFFNAFLNSTDIQTIEQTPVVSKPPTKLQMPKEVKDTLIVHLTESVELSVPEKESSEENCAIVPQTDKTEFKISDQLNDSQLQHADVKHSESFGSEDLQNKDDVKVIGTENVTACVTSKATNPDALIASNTEKVHKNSIKTEQLVSPPDSPSKSQTHPGKDLVLEAKVQKSEDRQSNTPSPPISTFSSGTSTTSDIEVLDHESVISESSASSRQEAVDSKMMQTSFQLLSTSACTDYQRLDEYQKLTESCGSSDAFERIDTFSVQSLDSQSVSEINSDDEMSSRGCNATAVSLPPSVCSTLPAEQLVKNVGESTNDNQKENILDESEMEESGRSATPVNSEQPEVLPVIGLTIIENHNTENIVTNSQPERNASIECQPSVEFENFKLQEIIDELTDKLEKREAQLLSVSKDKAKLEEAIDNLQDEMIRLKEESNSIAAIKDEFTQRIAESEKKAQLACKERDNIKKELKTMKAELSTRFTCNETADLVREKDEQIKGLMEEGEKLSKQLLNNSNIIKKLRAKEKENETMVAKQSKKTKEQEEEIKQLQQVLDGKEEVEKQHRENIKKLNGVVEKQEKEMSKLQITVEELQENNRSLQSALDSSYKELAELHKANAAKDSEAQEAALSHEIKTKEALTVALEQAQEEARQQQEALAVQVADLRIVLQRAEQQQARKEDYLRQEIGELQQRLQEADNRNQELSQSVTSASRPLLRQIENLQATLVAQSASWEKLEKNLSNRLADSQAQLAAAVEKERSVSEELLTLRTQVSSLDSQNSLLRQEKSRLQAQLESERVRLEKTEDESNKHHVEFDNLKTEYMKALEEARKEKITLTNLLEMEKLKVEQEKKKAILAQDALKEKDRKLFTNPGLEPVPSTPTLSRSSSVSGAEMASLQASINSQDDLFEHSFTTMTASTSGNNLYEALRMGAGSSIFENLQSQLKQREGEIAQLQLEISNLEKTRTIMAEELVKLTTQNDELQEKLNEIPKLRVQLRDIDQRYNTILQMYGEKAEEAEELRLDLEDVKNMYKTQIDELLKQRLT